MGLFYNLHTNISFNSIIHNSKESYKKSNYGGKKIIEWPFYNFLNIYIYDSEKIAENGFPIKLAKTLSLPLCGIPKTTSSIPFFPKITGTPIHKFDNPFSL